MLMHMAPSYATACSACGLADVAGHCARVAGRCRAMCVWSASPTNMHFRRQWVTSAAIKACCACAASPQTLQLPGGWETAGSAWDAPVGHQQLLQGGWRSGSAVCTPCLLMQLPWLLLQQGSRGLAPAQGEDPAHALATGCRNPDGSHSAGAQSV